MSSPWIVILKVGGLSAAADHIRQAIRTDGLGWRLVHVSTLNQARLALQRHRVDLLIVHHHLPDGEGLTADLSAFPGVPRVLSIEPGQEAVAAQALDIGFDDYVIETAQDGLGLVMLAQIRSALRHRDNARALVEQHGVLGAISRAQSRFIGATDAREAYRTLMDDLLKLTHSPLGFVGEVHYDDAGAPSLQVYAISEPPWDETSRRRLADLGGPGMRFSRLDSLYGEALRTGQPLVSDHPQADDRAGGLPKGHPTLRSFMAIPVGSPGALLALIGLANRPGGYHTDLLPPLQPLLDTVGQLVAARRAQRERADLLRHLQTTLDTMDQGLMVTGVDGRCVLYNQRLLALLELDESFLASRPTQSHVIRKLIARGDFGPDFSRVLDPVVRQWFRDGMPTLRTPALRYRRIDQRGRTLDIQNWTLPTGEVVRKFVDVTEEVHQRQALIDAREKLTNTLDGTQAGTWEWHIPSDEVTVNERFAALVGYRPTELPRRVESLYQLLLHPQDQPRLKQANARHLSGETPHYECQFRFRHRDGRWIWVLERGRINQRTPTGEPVLMSGITIDVTESKQAEEALQHTSELLRQRSLDLQRTLDTMSQGLMVVGADTRIRLFNRQLCDILELPESFFESQPLLQDLVAHQMDRGDFGPGLSLLDPSARPYVRQSRERPTDETPRRYVRRTSKGRYLEVKSDPLPGGGFIRTFSDVTPFVEAAESARERGEEVRRLNETLEHRVAERTAQLEQSMQDIEALSYCIAHDLRGPLRAVNGFAALIAAEEVDRLSPEGRELFARIVEASRRMGVMITDLLQLFKVVRADLQPAPVDLNQLAQEAVRALAAAYPRTHTEIQPLPAAIGDVTLLRVLMHNLIDNALKYSAKSDQPLVVVGWNAERHAWFVRDNGVGFDMARASKLFGLFQRLHSPADFDGSGLGLAVAARIAERHQGRIWADAEPGRGATFWIQLGLEPA